MEETRQYTALKALYFLWLGFGATAAALFLIILLAKLPAAGTVLVLLMFGAMASRTAFQWVAFVALRATGANCRAMAVKGIIWLTMTTGFFVFVVLYQFRHHV